MDEREVAQLWIVSVTGHPAHTPMGVEDGRVKALGRPYSTIQQAYAFLDGYQRARKDGSAP